MSLARLPPNEASGVLATETMHCWRLTGGMGFDWDNGSPDPDIGSDTFSARLTGQGDAPQVASHLHHHG